MTKDAFLHAFAQTPPPAGRALWLYGEAALASGDVYHPWRDQTLPLERKGCTVFSCIEAIGRDYDAVFVNCPKQQEQTEGLVALALERSKGFVMAVARGDAGGSRLPAMLKGYGLEVGQLSKSRCRVVWTHAAANADRSKIEANLAHLLPRELEMEGGRWWSVPGLFGWNKIDTGSRLLHEHLPPDLSGRVADFGCGFGYLSASLARYPSIEAVDALDADMRAVECAARNGGEKVNAQWVDVRALEAKPRYDAVVMNPPFHSGKQEDISLGITFIEKAWQSLKPRGRLFLVANRGLPYEKTVPGLTRVFEGEGYKILAGRAP